MRRKSVYKILISFLLLFLLNGLSTSLIAQTIGNPALREELLNRMKLDQEVRREINKYISQGTGAIPKEIDVKSYEIDKENMNRMKELIQKYGWLGESLVGKDGAHAAWILVQHADSDLAFQKKCVKLMKKAVAKGEASGRDFAYLTDRVLVAENKPQIYGTQMRFVNEKLIPAPIKDEANVDKRRKSIGLEPLAEYIKRMQGK